MFGEVVEDFSQVVHIKTRLEEWKFGFPDSYSQAHVPLYLPQLLAPFARLELLQWNPLEVRGNGGNLGDYFMHGVEDCLWLIIFILFSPLSGRVS